ncbi:MAG: hypothetical protein L0G70_05745 [Rubrobacter sp.]|nr:hypothetical protein [Rubrobacter sp.]
MNDDYYHRQREEDYYHRQREHDYYRRKRDRDRDDYQREQLFPSGKAPYNPFAAALRVSALVAALWLISAVLSLGEQIATEWWQTVFIIATVIVLLGVGKELVLCLIRCFSTGLSAIIPIISGAVVGLVAATVLHAAGVMGTVAAVLANAPTF